MIIMDTKNGRCQIGMIKAVFIDFYGTVVHEDGEVIKQVSQEIYSSGEVTDKIIRFLVDQYPKAYLRGKPYSIGYGLRSA